MADCSGLLDGLSNQVKLGLTNLPVNPYLRRQCLAKSVASLAVQSPFAFSFMLAHHLSLPTSGAHPLNTSRLRHINPKEIYLFVAGIGSLSLRYKDIHLW